MMAWSLSNDDRAQADHPLSLHRMFEALAEPLLDVSRMVQVRKHFIALDRSQLGILEVQREREKEKEKAKAETHELFF